MVVLQIGQGELQESILEGSLCFLPFQGKCLENELYGLYEIFGERGLYIGKKMDLEISQFIYFRHLLAVQKFLFL